MPKTKYPCITQKEVDRLIAGGHVAHVYPRKRIVCVDGFKYYTLKG